MNFVNFYRFPDFKLKKPKTKILKNLGIQPANDRFFLWIQIWDGYSTPLKPTKQYFLATIEKTRFLAVRMLVILTFVLDTCDMSPFFDIIFSLLTNKVSPSSKRFSRVFFCVLFPAREKSRFAILFQICFSNF